MDDPTASPLDPFVDLEGGRARFAVTTPAPVELPAVEGLLAGVAEVDLTPPPGLPKAGYSANAHDGEGFRTRLRARVFHLRAGRSSLAIVACDLLGGSSVLQHLVAGAVARTTDVPLSGLMIGATHTHAGPGQFLGTDFYNRFASNRAGFDPAWARFLVERIAGAVTAAHDDRVPARAALGTTEVWGLTRNRSLDPHVHNATVADTRLDPQRKWVAVNPELHLLRVDTTDGDALGSLVVFSVHGTGISQHSREYNADLWAYLVGDLDRRIEADAGRRAVVGAMEGTHADVAPALRPGQAGHVEAQRIGRGIGEQAHALWRRLEGGLSTAFSLGHAFREVDLDAGRRIDDVELPDRPAVGAALVAGAKENTTPVLGWLPPFRAGMPHRGPGRDSKRVLGTRWLQPLLLPTRGFPRVLPVQVLRLGDALVVGLPFEVTTEAGRRIAASVADTGHGPAPVIVSSVANEYSGYVTTAEEYARQYYEGGHTLYGPDTQRFLAAHAARLAGELARASDASGHGRVDDGLGRRSWDVGVQRFLPRPGPDGTRRAQEGPATFSDPTASADGWWEMIWRDVPPGNLAWHEPLVHVEHDDGDGWQPTPGALGRPVTDQGWELEVRHLGAHGDLAGAHRYSVRWYQPDHRAGRRYRFVLAPNAGRRGLAGDPFD